MEVHVLLFLTCFAVNSVKGQFSDYEYRLDNVPLPVKRRLSSARYEVQPSASREIVHQDAGTARNPSQGHIDNNHRGNLQNVHNARQNEHDFEAMPHENQNKNFELNRPTERDSRRVQHVSNYDQFNAQIRQQTQENQDRVSSAQHVNRNTEYQNTRNNGKINPTFYDANLKTNLQNTHSQQNIQRSPSQDISYDQRNYLSNDNARTNEHPTTQLSNTRIYENTRQSESTARTNANNRNFVKLSPSQDSYNQQNYPSNDNLRTSDNPTNQQIDRVYENSRTKDNNENGLNKNINTETITRRVINTHNEHRQKVDSAIIKNNRNSEGNLNTQNTETRKEHGNRNYDRQTTEPTRRITIQDRVVTGGTKSTQDNELASKIYSDGSSGTMDDEKWVWSAGSEMNRTTTVTTTLPEVDDRAAFVGEKCPAGQVKINKMCVYKDEKR